MRRWTWAVGVACLVGACGTLFAGEAAPPANLDDCLKQVTAYKYGDSRKRLWPTEFGWASSSNPVAGYEYAVYNSEQNQAEYIVRAYQMMRDWGWVGVPFLWNLNYNVTQPGSELAAFGIQGRAAYEALKSARGSGALP